MDTRQRFSFSFCKLRYAPSEFNSLKIAKSWNKGVNFKTARIHCLGDVFAVVAIVVA